MKKVLLLSALLIFACSSDDSSDSDSNNNDNNDNPPAIQIGDFVQGGIVFWINPDDPNNGMVISANQGGDCQWGGYTDAVGQVLK